MASKPGANGGNGNGKIPKKRPFRSVIAWLLFRRFLSFVASISQALVCFSFLSAIAAGSDELPEKKGPEGKEEKHEEDDGNGEGSDDDEEEEKRGGGGKKARLSQSSQSQSQQQTGYHTTPHHTTPHRTVAAAPSWSSSLIW